VLLCPQLFSTVFHCLSVRQTYRPLVMCLSVHCCLLQSVHGLWVSQILPSLASVSLCPLLSYMVCPVTVSTSHSTVCCFCTTMYTAVS
jgi:hypothetical protein